MKKIIPKILNRLNIPYTNKVLIEYSNIQENLVSYTQFFDSYRIPNITIKIKPSDLLNLNLPVLAHCKEDDKNYFVVINSLTTLDICYYDVRQGNVTENIETFSKKWTGVVQLYSPDEASVEPDFNKNKRLENGYNFQKYSLIFIILLLCISQIVFRNNFIESIQYLFSVTGLVLSGLLLYKGFGENNTLTNKLCNVIKKSNCDKVLNSEGGKFLGLISWSEIGFIYFVSNTICLSISHGKFLLYANLLTWLFIPYSIYYQAKVIKSWCIMCLGIQLIFLINGLMWFTLTNSYNLKEWHLENAYIFLSIVGVWFFLRPVFQRSKEFFQSKNDLMTFKDNSTLFKAFLETQRPVTDVPCEDIVLGDPSALIELLLISSPTCKFCKDAHHTLVSLANYFNEDICLKIRFIGESDLHQELISYFYSISDTQVQIKAIEDWYSINNLESWKALYPIEIIDSYRQVCTKNSTWAYQNGVIGTPMVFLNNYPIESPYSYNDIEKHIRFLSEGMLVPR